MSSKPPRGEAETFYYENAQSGNNNEQYQAQDGYNPTQYTQQPPSYGNNTVLDGSQQQGGEKVSFEETFKIDRPKYNDLWAAILFVAVFLGFTAVSGVAVNGYGMILQNYS